MSPYENEFSCRVLDSKEFDHFRRQDRESEGKKLVAVIAWKNGKTSQTQGYRYHKDIWTEELAKEHCKAHKGTFKALKIIKGNITQGGENMPINKKKFDKIQKEHFKEFQKIGETGQEYLFVSPGMIELKEDHLVDIEVLREGEWKHPKAPNGLLVLTKEKLREFVQNFKDSVVGKELPIDIDHKESGTAVGWLRKLWLVGKDGLDHLWGQIDITDPDTQQKIKEGSLKFFSPSLNYGWIDPEHPERKYDLIRAGALTNWPYLKGMSPAVVNFSEISEGKNSPERTNGHKLKLVESQRDKWKKIALTEIKEKELLLVENQTLSLELKMSELGSQGRITPAEKYQVRELQKLDHNSGLIALKIYESRANPVVEFGQKSEIMAQKQTGSSNQELIKLCESEDKGVRDAAMREVSRRYDLEKNKGG